MEATNASIPLPFTYFAMSFTFHARSTKLPVTLQVIREHTPRLKFL